MYELEIWVLRECIEWIELMAFWVFFSFTFSSFSFLSLLVPSFSRIYGFLELKFMDFVLFILTTLYVCVCYRYIGRLGRSMGWSTQRMRYWTDTEGHMGSLGVDPVSGQFQFFSPFPIFLDYMVVINYVVITSYFLNLIPLFFFFFISSGSLSYIFCLYFKIFQMRCKYAGK